MALETTPFDRSGTLPNTTEWRQGAELNHTFHEHTREMYPCPTFERPAKKVEPLPRYSQERGIGGRPTLSDGPTMVAGVGFEPTMKGI